MKIMMMIVIIQNYVTKKLNLLIRRMKKISQKVLMVKRMIIKNNMLEDQRELCKIIKTNNI